MLKKFFGNFSLVGFLVALVLVWGSLLFWRMPIALYPQTSRPVLNVSINPRGIHTEDFYEKYGKDLEEKIRSLKDVEKLEGIYEPNNVDWRVQFGWNYEEDKARDLVKAALSPFEAEFPKSWGKFQFWFQNGGNTSEIVYTLHSDSMSREELYKLLTERVKPKLEVLPGFQTVGFARPYEKEILIELDEDKMLDWGITPGDVRAAVDKGKEDVTLGTLKMEHADDFTVLVPVKNHTVEDIGATYLKTIDERDIKIQDIAAVTLQKNTPHYLNKGNGERAVTAFGQIETKANIAQACDSFARVLKDSLKEMGGDIRYEELLNPSLYIKDAVSNVGFDIFLGILITMLLLYLILGSFRYTMINAIAIPLSLIGGVIVMYILGIEINLVSLGAMALASGIVVDGATVVLENLIRHFEIHAPESLDQKITVAIGAMREVRGAVIATLLTHMVVFAPLAFTAPLANAILGDLAKVMVCVLLISIFVSLYIIPPIFLFLQRRGHGGGVHGSEPEFVKRTMKVFEWSKDLYLESLRKILESRTYSLRFLGACGVLCIGALLIFVFGLTREILPKPDTDKVWLHVNGKQYISDMDKADEVYHPYEVILQKEFMSDMTHFYTGMNSRGAHFLCNLKNKHKVNEFKKRLEERFKSTALIQFHVNTWIPTSLEIPNPPLVFLEVLGETREEKRAILEKLTEFLEKQEFIGWVNESPDTKLSQKAELILDPQAFRNMKAQVPSFSEEVIYDHLRVLLSEKNEIASTYDGNEKIPIYMQYPKVNWNGPQDLGNQSIKIGEDYIPMTYFYKVEAKKHWEKLFTIDGREVVQVKAYLKETSGGHKASLAQKLRKDLQELRIPTKSISFLDTDKDINESIYSLVIAMVLAIVFVWLVVSFEFSQWQQSVIVMSAIPLGFVGAALALFAFQASLSVNTMLGLILLSGTAVNNSILFVDFYNNEQVHTLGRIPRILHTADLRFRPIILTALATILGALPIALGMGTGGEVLQSLGIIISLGFGISTPLTLYVVPILLHFARD